MLSGEGNGLVWPCMIPPSLYGRQGSRPSPRKRNAKSKMAVWGGGLTNICEKKRSEKQRRKGMIHVFECRVPKNSKER